MNTICNFNTLLVYQLSDSLYIGQSPYGLFNQDEIVAELKNCGVTVIVSLLEYDEIKYDISLYLQNFKHIALPTQKGEVPSLSTIKRVFSLMDAGEVIYLHSMSGLGRANVVVATYLHEVYDVRGEALLKKLMDVMDGTKIGIRWGQMSAKQKRYIQNL